MILGEEDRKKYPNCTRLLTNLGSTVRAQPDVLKAFLDVCKADDQFKSTDQQVEAIAQRALRWSTPPTIEVEKGLIKAVAGGKSVEACGWNNSFRTPVLIEITSFWFDAFEFGSPADRAKNTVRLTRTVLHELVHWVRNEAGASDDALDGSLFRGGHYREAGELFEERAFGVASLCNDNELGDAILSRRT